jgi:preprotein translocase subunit SecG
MTSTLLIVQIVLAVAITIAVLLQKSSSIGLGAYSGSNESVFGAKGPTGFLAKLTFSLAFAFIINTLVLGYLYTTANTASVVDTIVPANNAAVPSVPVTQENAAPTVPATQENTTPVAPAAPATN